MKTPFIGCAYYPEDWDESQIPVDIAKMKEMGITCARVGEFAWAKMEPFPGKYDFEWLHKVVDALAEAGISVILGTPTACPPAWFVRMYPEAIKTDIRGRRAQVGTRRHGCSASPIYREESRKIVEKMAMEFADDPNVIGWQIDNEIDGGGYDLQCHCEHCMKYFHDNLRKRYGTIEEFKRRLDMNIFSQNYDSFEDIETPFETWNGAQMHFEWELAKQWQDIEYIHMQSDILQKYVKVPIGTDLMPLGGMDMEKLSENLSVIQFNHYNRQDNLIDVTFWFDYIRTLLDRPYWNTETSPTWPGGIQMSFYMQPEGFCRVNTWLSIALGGECTMYWLWRQHWAGHELMHGSVLLPSGRPVYTACEIEQAAVEFEKASDFINNTKVKADVAMHFTATNWILFNYQRIAKNTNYLNDLLSMHRRLTKKGLRTDVIGAKHSLDDYKVLLSPLMMTMEEANLAEDIKKWVADGGVWVVGPMSDVRNDIGAHYVDREMGFVEDMLGIKLTYLVATDGTVLTSEWADGTPMVCNRLAECYTSDSGKAIAKITGGHSALVDTTVIGEYEYGKGKVIVVGTILDDESYTRVIDHAIELAGVKYYKATGSVVVSPRVGENMEGLILAEVGYQESTVMLDSAMRDILTDKVYEAGEMKVAPYAVHVLVKE